jgi:hypothetical protein
VRVGIVVKDLDGQLAGACFWSASRTLVWKLIRRIVPEKVVGNAESAENAEARDAK